MKWKHQHQLFTKVSNKKSPPAEDTVFLNPEHSIKNLLELINRQKEKINTLTKRVAFLEQTMRELQISAIIVTNTSKIERLKQYS